MPDATVQTDTPRPGSAWMRRGRPQPTLTVVCGPRTGRSFSLVPQEFSYVLGRGETAHIQVIHDTVSREHAEIVVEEVRGEAPRATLLDRGSTNGTWVNGEPARQQRLAPGDKVQIGDVVFRFDLLDRVDPSYLERVRETVRTSVFEAALESISLVYQPLVDARTRVTVGWEALLRTDTPLLPDPLALLEAAKGLGKLWQLDRAARDLAARAAVALPPGADLFVNVHPDDLADETLYDPGSALARVASQVVIELTERSSLAAIEDAEERVAALRALGFRIAVDDLGAGYSGLTSVARLKPDVVKIDMDLVRGVDEDDTKAALIRSVAVACRETGARLVAEGVETAGEQAKVVELGCDLLQGFYVARPHAGFASVLR